MRAYKKFYQWYCRALNQLEKLGIIGICLMVFLFAIWVVGSMLFVEFYICYGIYYLIRLLCHLIFKTPMPDKTPEKAPSNGYEYEERVAKSLRRKGYRNVEVTAKSGDYGADVIATDPHGNRVCIQCKFYKSPVGLTAVQEIVSAKAKYHCSKAAVYTNSTFTNQAKELAFVNDVDLFEMYDAILN